MREETVRRLLLVAAVTCWAASGTLVGCLVFGAINTTTRPGITSLVVLLQSLAITCTVVLAQFRVRRVMVAVLKAGITLDEIRKGEK